MFQIQIFHFPQLLFEENLGQIHIHRDIQLRKYEADSIKKSHITWPHSKHRVL